MFHGRLGSCQHAALRSLCAVAILIVVVNLGVVAQNSQPAPSKDPKSTGKVPNAPTYSSSELDLQSNRLAPRFKGNNIAVVAQQLLARTKQGARSEFETTEQWKRRTTLLWSRPLVGNMTVKSVWAFVLEEVPSLYDADRQILNVHIPFFIPYFLGEPREEDIDRRRVMEARTTEGTSRDYIGSNAFGTRVRVTESHSLTYNIGVDNWAEFVLVDDRYHQPTALNAAIQSEPTKARRIKDGLSAVVLCRLAEPFIVTDYHSSEATVDLPFATHHRMFNVIVKLIEVWFFDKASGTILSKIVSSG